MWRFPWSKHNSASVGLEFQAEGIACVATSGAQLLQMDFLRYQSGLDPAEQLKNWVHGHRLKHAQCKAVLGPEQYQILLVEPPEVAPEELRAALRWRLKDLLQIPLEQAVVDVFSLPEDGTRSKKKMVYAVAAERGRIQALIAQVAAAELQLVSIDVVELALRNLAMRLVSEDNAERGIAIARVRPGGGSICLYRKGNMYLARNFSLSYKGGLLDDLPEEALALELQRSLDYYERQMGQVPPSVVYVGGENVLSDKLGPTLRASLAAKVLHLDPAAAVSAPESMDNALMQSCVGALGGVLREEQAA